MSLVITLTQNWHKKNSLLSLLNKTHLFIAASAFVKCLIGYRFLLYGIVTKWDADELQEFGEYDGNKERNSRGYYIYC